MAFLATPSIVAYIDNSVDISFVFNVNEEESSSTNKINLEYKIEETSNHLSIQYLQDKKNSVAYYIANYSSINLDIIIPPPRLIA